MRGKGFSENRGFSLFPPTFSFKLPFSSPGGSQAPGLWARLQSHLTLAAWLSFTSLWNRGQRHRLSDGWQGRPGCGSRARCPLLAGAALDPRPERARLTSRQLPPLCGLRGNHLSDAPTKLRAASRLLVSCGEDVWAALTRCPDIRRPGPRLFSRGQSDFQTPFLPSMDPHGC